MTFPTSAITNLSVTETNYVNSCHKVEGRLLVFISSELVDKYGLEDESRVEQVPTGQGILLRRVS